MLRRRKLPPPSLRTKTLLLLLLGAVLPLGVVGAWLARSAERAAERLLRERLEGALVQIAGEVTLRWVRLRSGLLTIAEHPATLAALANPAGGTAPATQLLSLFAQLEGEVVRLAVARPGGDTALALGGVPSVAGRAGAGGTMLPVQLAIHDPLGKRLGTLHAELAPSALVPSGAGWAVASGVLGIFEPGSGTPLLPLTIDPDAFRQARFIWAGDSWLSARRSTSEPPLELVLAAPLGPVSGPFAEATRRGTLALAAVALAAVVLATLVTGRMTRSLERLADGAGAVAAGDLERSVEVGVLDEVGRVARAFNEMTDSLRSTLGELAQRESLAAVGEFAARLAHEVRNPLTSVRLDLQRAEERITDPTGRELITHALRSVERLDATVTGVLRVARSGKVERRPISLRGPLEAAMESAQPAFAARGARLEPLADGAGQLTVRGDAAALEQLFLNLLLNAAQAVGDGGRAGLRCSAGEREVEVTVWDTGPGIPQEARERVFEPFYSTRPDGTGLGLAIARQIAAAHGGRLAVEDNPGGGAAFRVTLLRAFSAPA